MATVLELVLILIVPPDPLTPLSFLLELRLGTPNFVPLVGSYIFNRGSRAYPRSFVRLTTVQPYLGSLSYLEFSLEYRIFLERLSELLALLNDTSLEVG